MFELFEDADALDLFEMQEPSDASLASHSWANRQLGVADQRLQAWWGTAAWRSRTAREYDDPATQRENRRVAQSLRTLANFVAELPDSDPGPVALARSVQHGDHYDLSPRALTMLSRFGLNRGAFVGRAVPDAVQLRNLLRRVEGQERHARDVARRGVAE